MSEWRLVGPDFAEGPDGMASWRNGDGTYQMSWRNHTSGRHATFKAAAHEIANRTAVERLFSEKEERT